MKTIYFLVYYWPPSPAGFAPHFCRKNCFGYCLRKKLSNLRVLTRNEWAIVQHVREPGQTQPGPAQHTPYHPHSFPSQSCWELESKILWTWQCITICTSLLRAALCSVIYPRSTWCSAVYPCWDCVQRYIHIVKVFRLWLCSIISIHVSIIFNNLSILWCVKQPIHVMDGVQLSVYRASLKT